MTAQNKTRPTSESVRAFIDSVTHPVRQSDARSLVSLMHEVSGAQAEMWGPSIVGFGRYHYRYESGREGDSFRIGFSPRKANLSLYLMADFDELSSILARLGKFKRACACLYVNTLADVDMEALRALCVGAWAEMARRYPL